jgi:CheY-like chemotaxis protein
MQVNSRRLRVLVVDDNEDTAQILTLLAGLWGFEAHAALGGAEALNEARAFHPDVVLCDLAMPDMDGCAVAERLRRQSANAGTLLVAVTSYGDDDHRRQAARAGFHAHFVKPVEPRDLRRLLDAQATDLAAKP